ncbi:hypothetical protein [Legionella worsleiensis]|uniref:Uncharacterized protein n=1 Tax=Legionella worsleiensis TaxID=45076 RepID=A0A0W1AEB1_9GAMM|nr:hypothetical protein [Legionella worsleiensis]KTD79656.1 hypothetical protein Lwor_1170 [Legionella worsleiensis]STY32166.1 Uncharacterised protein [Legionella worsleiensis]
MAGHSFFSQVRATWNEYGGIRDKYAEAIPKPQKSYLYPIYTINEFATLAIRPIEKPLWLGIHALSFFFKTILSALASMVLTPCALALVIIAPASELSRATCSSFKLTAAHTLVSAGMAVLALLSTAAALILNPLYIATRASATVVECVGKTIETCCG